MSCGEKVITMDQTKANKDGWTMPATLIRLRDKSAARFNQLLNAFFDSADDALFDLSERAYSNADQNTYFDAMRELRMQRKSMTLSFQQWLNRAFDEGGQCQPKNASASDAETDFESLSLVDNETLEEQVAVDNMIMRIRNRYSEPVELIRLRIAELLKNPDLESAQNPLGPEVICHGLAEVCSELSIDIRSRLVIYKLFDKLLITQLGCLYQEANQHLIDDGVLPRIRNPAGGKSAQPRQGGGTGSSAQSAAGGVQRGGTQGSASAGDGVAGGGSDGGGADMETLLQLLRNSGGAMPLTGVPSSGGGSGVADMTPVQTNELVQMLSGVQLQGVGGSGTLGPMVTNLAEQQQKDVRRADSDVINLVSMLFDFILEDHQLPGAIKALIARLQIPMVKVALVDPEFFERRGHPARRLLNELAGAAMIWNGDAAGRTDPLYEQMEAAISRIQNEFSDDISVFESALDEFSAFMEKDKRRRERVEQRLRDAEEGRARDEQAKEAVRAVVSRAVGEHSVPQSIRDFLYSGWSRVLKWYYLREGDEGQGWKHYCDLTDRLIWTLDPQPSVRSTRSALLREIPRVVSAIREGLHVIAWDPFDIDKCLHELELVHVDVLQQLKTAPDDSAVSRNTASADEKGSEWFNIADVGPPGVAADSDTYSVDNEAAANEAVETEPDTSGDDGRTEPESGALAESETEVKSDTCEAGSAQEQAPPAMPAPNLGVGAWLEWHPGEGESIRCKLAAVIRATGKYIFVNRNGARVVEYMQDEVSRALSNGTLERLDDGMIFDRALESVIDSLRNSKAGWSV